MTLTINNIKDKMNCEYVNKTCYYMVTFIDENNIDSFDEIEFVTTYEYFDIAEKTPEKKCVCYKTTHPTKTMLKKDPDIYRVNHYAVLK